MLEAAFDEAWLTLKSIGNTTVKPDELARSVLLQKLATDVGKITDDLKLCYDKDRHTKINVWWVERTE